MKYFVAVDGSEQSNNAFEWALEHCKKGVDEMFVLCVVEFNYATVGYF